MIVPYALISCSSAIKVSSSFSSRANSNNSCAPIILWLSWVRVSTTPSSIFFSLPSAWACFWSSQILGSSRIWLTSVRRRDLTSKSKIPPKRLLASQQIIQGITNQIELFSFHTLIIRAAVKLTEKLRSLGTQVVGLDHQLHPCLPLIPIRYESIS